MEKRINIIDLEPDAYQAMLGLEKYLGKTTLDVLTKQLVKIRTAQINGCAYCIQMHTQEARKSGESEQRIYALSAWKESPLFTDKEKALLSLTDEITLISKNGLNRDCYEQALQALGENALAQAIMLIITANAWNRIAVATAMRHE